MSLFLLLGRLVQVHLCWGTVGVYQKRELHMAALTVQRYKATSICSQFIKFTCVIIFLLPAFLMHLEQNSQILNIQESGNIDYVYKKKLNIL